ncbi:sulfotransferase family protein [Salinibius halmophilus]|uniref:sulfotransferase family protein n=1 Tax=Salinibius halmophilus TaxID=1853216 RepID=UPI001313EC7E|nr:sulfotransferase family protein [Salinibius halmophilus]
MTVKVIGAGFGRTGTKSLQTALEALGFGPTYHMSELVKNPQHVPYWRGAMEGEQVNWHEFLDGYHAIVDFPGCLYYKELMEAYPDAKVVLTTRDAEKWFESASKTILNFDPHPVYIAIMRFMCKFSKTARGMSDVGMYNSAELYEKLFQNRKHDKDFVIDVFNQHIEAVRAAVPADRLLEYQVSEGWEPLCEFLNVDVPNKDFPRSNDRNDFDAEFKGKFLNLRDARAAQNS